MRALQYTHGAPVLAFDMASHMSQRYVSRHAIIAAAQLSPYNKHVYFRFIMHTITLHTNNAYVLFRASQGRCPHAN